MLETGFFLLLQMKYFSVEIGIQNYLNGIKAFRISLLKILVQWNFNIEEISSLQFVQLSHSFLVDGLN